MLNKLLIISLTLCIYAEKQEDKMCRLSNNKEDSSVTGDFVNSFVRLKDKLGNFFRLSMGNAASKIEKRRKKLKKAFQNFIDEAFYDKDNYTKNKRTMHLRTSFGDVPVGESQTSASRLILSHGYRVEVHTVRTHDKYLLRLQRILPNLQNSVKMRTSTVILHHGLMGSSEDWLLLGPTKALPYLLSEEGYDVWLTNSRGSKYSNFVGTSFSNKSSEFWNFSFHEMGTLDLPAVIDYVKDKCKRDSEINFVGFSMGATALLIQLSMLPKYNRVLKSATLLAPLAFMHQIKGPLKLFAEFYVKNGRNSLNFLGENEFMPIDAFPQQVMKKYCQGDGKLCLNPLLLIANGGKEILDKNILRNVLNHLPSGASVKTILHYIQLVNSGQFQRYDAGPTINVLQYGLAQPPLYDLTNINLPILVISSSDDWLSTRTNVMRLVSVLPNVAGHHIISQHDFSHTDFIWGEDAPHLVFHLVIDMLGQLSDKPSINVYT